MKNLIVLALFLALFYPIKGAIAEAPIQIGLSKTGETLILETFGKKEPFVSIARCESQWRQFDEKGGVLHGTVNHKDIGFFQISETYWLDSADKLGYNIYTLEDNIKMAKYIYDKQGLEAWRPSELCWGMYTMRATKKVGA